MLLFVTSGASDERVAPVSRRTGAHGPVRARSVKPGLALGAGAAGVGGAQVLPLELAAADEGVPGVALGAAADRLVVGGLAGGALSTHVGVWLVARVAALEPDARLVAGAVSVPGALCVAPGVGVAQEVRRARALGPVVHRLTVGILSAGAPAAGILTPRGNCMLKTNLFLRAPTCNPVCYTSGCGCSPYLSRTRDGSLAAGCQYKSAYTDSWVCHQARP